MKATMRNNKKLSQRTSGETSDTKHAAAQQMGPLEVKQKAMVVYEAEQNARANHRLLVEHDITPDGLC
jgi:hypothetical protein